MALRAGGFERRQSAFFLRRHLAGVDRMQHLLPDLSGRKRTEIVGQDIRIHFAFRRVCSVAIRTVVLDNLPTLHRHRGGWCNCGRAGEQEGRQQQALVLEAR